MVAARFSVPHAQLLRNIETDMPKDEDDVERGLEADRKLTKKMSVMDGTGDFLKYSFARYRESR